MFTKLLRTDITFNMLCMEATDFLICFQLLFRQKFWAHDVRCIQVDVGTTHICTQDVKHT